MATSVFRPNVLSGSVALITGGGSGIGFEIARQLGLHGSSVVLMGRRQQFLDEAVGQLQREGVQAAAYAGDVRREEDAEAAVATAVDRFGKLNILVNSAAGNFLANAHELRTKGFKTVMDIDTVGVFNMSRHAYPALAAAGDARIISISATLHEPATWYQAHASAAKAAIDSLTRSLALEWGQDGIRVTGIAPGPIANTPGMTKLAPGVEQAEIEAMIAEHIPAGRMGTTMDIGQMAVFLASPAGEWVTGDTVIVDGGAWLHREARIPRDMVSEMSRAVEGKSRAMGPGPKSRL